MGASISDMMLLSAELTEVIEECPSSGDMSTKMPSLLLLVRIFGGGGLCGLFF